MTLTAHPTFPAKGAANFNALILAWAQFMAGTNKTELDALVVSLNALSASMTSVAAGGALTIPYTFSSTVTVADPTAGYLRLDNATQNTATAMLVDLVGADGTTWTSVIDTFDDSGSTVKGNILLQKLSDGSKWLEFSVSAVASPSGYRNITVANVGGSSASPFADGDALVLKFSRNGDPGPTGAAGVSGAWLRLAVLTPSAAANIDFLSTFSATYDAYRVTGTGITVAADDAVRLRLAVAGSADAGSNYYVRASDDGTVVTSTATSINITGTMTSAGLGGNFQFTIYNANDAANIKSVQNFSSFQTNATPGFIINGGGGHYTAANAVTGGRLFLNGGSNFGATGTIVIEGLTKA